MLQAYNLSNEVWRLFSRVVITYQNLRFLFFTHPQGSEPDNNNWLLSLQLRLLAYLTTPMIGKGILQIKLDLLCKCRSCEQQITTINTVYMELQKQETKARNQREIHVRPPNVTAISRPVMRTFVQRTHRYDIRAERPTEPGSPPAVGGTNTERKPGIYRIRFVRQLG